MFEFKGIAYCFGDDINTDYIISSRRKKDTINPDELVQFLMEDIRPGFGKSLSGTGLIIAGENFGCGSAMEVAAQVVKSANIPVIIAKSFARSYYRNAINNGIIPLEMDTTEMEEGDSIQVTQTTNGYEITNFRTGKKYHCSGFSGKVREILEYGGLISYMKKTASR